MPCEGHLKAFSLSGVNVEAFDSSNSHEPHVMDWPTGKMDGGVVLWLTLWWWSHLWFSWSAGLDPGIWRRTGQVLLMISRITVSWNPSLIFTYQNTVSQCAVMQTLTLLYWFHCKQTHLRSCSALLRFMYCLTVCCTNGPEGEHRYVSCLI